MAEMVAESLPELVVLPVPPLPLPGPAMGVALEPASDPADAAC